MFMFKLIIDVLRLLKFHYFSMSFCYLSICLSVFLSFSLYSIHACCSFYIFDSIFFFKYLVKTELTKHRRFFASIYLPSIQIYSSNVVECFNLKFNSIPMIIFLSTKKKNLNIFFCSKFKEKVVCFYS